MPPPQSLPPRYQVAADTASEGGRNRFLVPVTSVGTRRARNGPWRRERISRSSTPRQIRLVFRIAKDAAIYIRETPLSADQTACEERATIRFEATVPDGIGLRTWILAQGAAMEILKPKELRYWITRTLTEALKPYR